MIRTQIYIPEEINRYLNVKAKQTKKPKAQVIRDALFKDMKHEQQQHNLGTALLKLADLHLHTDDPNFSENIDKYLYENP